MAKRLLLTARLKTKKCETTLEAKSSSIHNFFERVSKGKKGLLEDALVPGELWMPPNLPNLQGYGSLDGIPELYDSKMGAYNYSWLRHVKLGEGISVPLGVVVSNTEVTSYLSNLKLCIQQLWADYLQDKDQVMSFTVDPDIPGAAILASSTASTADPL